MKKQVCSIVIAFLAASFSLYAQVVPTIVASGFNPGLTGIEVDATGNIWVTESGSGNNDGRILIVDPNTGDKTIFMTGLPSTYIQAAAEVVGSYRTYQQPNNKVLIVVGEGDHALSETLLLVDKSAFTPGTPLTLTNVEQVIDHGDFVHAQGFVQSNPFNVAWDAAGNIYTADAGANSIVKWDKMADTFSIVKTIDRFPNPLPFGPPMVDPVPTKVLRKPDGTFHVSQLTGFPFIQGAANVYNLDAAGNLSVHAAGFSCLTDMAFDPKDGNLCVMQFGIFGQIDSVTLNFFLGSAAVIKLLPDGTRQTIAEGIGGLAPSFTFDPAGNLYVVDLVFGQVLKYDLVSATKESAIAAASVKTFPNPFAEQVTVEYELTQAAVVTLDIFDLGGRKVAGIDAGQKSPGTYTARWNGNNGSQQAASGMYIYRLMVGNELVSGLIQLAR
ncbi:MAG: ScyD/ScyE family protein [Lewinellaceae bacterium]|nr:ScyD/ScyE family protein [Lewinellaceae bacterium]